MTGDIHDPLATRLRSHVLARGVPSLPNGAWSMMLEAADRLDAFAVAQQRIRERRTDIVDLLIQSEHENILDEAEMARLDALIRDRRRTSSFLRAEQRGLNFACDELADVPYRMREPELPLPEPAAADLNDLERLTGDDEWRREIPIEEAAPAQPDSERAAAAAPESGAEGEAVQAEDAAEV